MSEIQSLLQQQSGSGASNNAIESNDRIHCQWVGCSERCISPEALYDHICEQHVGRKSTNNLNLTCAWGTCRTTTVKRDHITSHIRVHVPLKPHKCDICAKSFKRPQDLKKHVKTHADDSVILRSPEPLGDPNFPPYRLEGGKAINTDLQALAATATGYYEPPMQGRAAPQQYNQQSQAPNPSYYGGTQQQPYGPVYYAVSQAGDLSQQAALESRKRGYSALNEFFGDAKRRQIDPTSYHDVGQRLLALQGLQIPTYGSTAEYSSAPAMVEVGGHGASALLQNHYALPPMPNLRTKNDMVNIDQFLEQMAATVYESSNQAAAAGVAQPGVHSAHSGMGFRHSHSPPSAAYMTATSQASTASAMAPMMAATSSESTHSTTPALTPPSSTLSHVSAHSPSTSGFSPVSRTSAVTYPSLATVTSGAEMATSYPSSMTTPASILGTTFDQDPRHRYGGGVLQKAAPAPEEDAMDICDGDDDNDTTPGPRSPAKEGTDVNANIDPALAEPRKPNLDPSPEELKGATAMWVENIRTIESLRRFIAERIKRRDFVEDDDEDDQDVMHDDEVRSPLRTASTASDEAMERLKEAKSEHEKQAESLYPVLRAVEDSGL